MELRLYFPSEFRGDNSTVDYNNNLKGLLLLEFGKLAGEDVTEEAIYNKEKEILMLDLPNIWNIHNGGNMEVEMETEFTKFLYAVGEHTNEDMDSITVFGFYALLGFIKEKNKPTK